MTTLAPIWTDHCEALARTAVEGKFAPGLDRDDLLQEARIGVAEAQRDWRPDGGANFGSFAIMCGRRKVISAIVAARRQKHEVLNTALSFEAPLGRAGAGSDDWPGRVGDLLFSERDDPCRIVLAREELWRLIAALLALTPWERECVARCSLLGEPYDEVGPHKSVDNALQRARRKMLAAA